MALSEIDARIKELEEQLATLDGPTEAELPEGFEALEEPLTPFRPSKPVDTRSPFQQIKRGKMTIDDMPEGTISVQKNISDLVSPDHDDSWITTKAKGAALLANQVSTIVMDYVPLTVARMLRSGDETLADVGTLDNWITMNKEEANAKRVLTEKGRDNVWLTMPVFGDITFGDIEDMSESFGYSIANAATTSGGALAATQAGALMGATGGPIGSVIGALGGLIAGTISSGSASKDAFIDDVKQKYLAQRAPDGQITPTMEKEWQGIYDEIKDDAVLYGAWEAAPETLGNILTFGIMKGGGKVTGKILDSVKSDVARKIGSGAMKMTAMYAEESGTEILTTKKQSEIEARHGLRAKPLNYGEAWDEVKAQVGLMSTLTGLGGAALIRRDAPKATTTDSVTSAETKELQTKLDEAKGTNDLAQIVEIQDALSQSVVRDEEKAKAQVAEMKQTGSILDPSTPAGQAKITNDEAGLPSTVTGAVNEDTIVRRFQEIATALNADEKIAKKDLTAISKQVGEITGEKVSNEAILEQINQAAQGSIGQNNPMAPVLFQAMKNVQEGPKVVEQAPTAPQEGSKEQIINSLTKQRNTAADKLRSLEGRMEFGDVPADEKMALREEIARTHKELNARTAQLENAVQYQGMVPDHEAWRLLGLNPRQMQSRVLQDAGVSESAFQKRVQEEEKRNARIVAENQKNIRRTFQTERRKKALRAAEEEVKERQLVQQIQEEEAREEAAVVAEVTEEEAPARTRTPFQPTPVLTKEQDVTPAFERRVAKEQERIREEAPAPTTTDKRVFKGRMPEAEPKKPSLKPRRPLSQEERFLARAEQGTILSSGQKPYKTAESALRALRKLDEKAQKGYEVVQTKGGFGIRLKKDATGLRTRFSTTRYSIPKSKAESDVQFKKAKQEVGRIGKKLSKRTRGLVSLDVLKSPRDLLNIPGGKEIYRNFKENGVLDTVRGVNINNKIYFFTDRIDTRSISLPQLVLHELRHWSVGELMGPKTHKLFEQYANDNMGEIERRLNLYGLPMTDDLIMREAEEIMIENYKDGVKSNLLDQIVTAIRQFIRDVFDVDLAVSDAEVKSFLNAIDKNIKEDRKNVKGVIAGRAPRYNANAEQMSKEEIDEYYKQKDAKSLGREVYELLTGKSKQTEFGFRTRFITNTFDQTAPIKWKANQYNEKTGKRTEAYEKVRITSSTGSISDAVSWDGMIEFKEDADNRTGWITVNKEGEYKGYLREVQKLGEHADVFMRYLQAERVTEEMQRDAALNKKRAKEGKRPVKRLYYGKGIDDVAMVNGVLREAEAAKTAVGEAKWNRAIDAIKTATKAKLDLAQKVGVINAEERAQWERNIYVPLAREIEENYNKFNADRRGPTVMGALIKTGIQQLEARTDKKVGDPLENFIRNYNFMINEAVRNIARRDTVSMLMELNDGSVELTKRPPSKYNPNVISVQVGGKEQYVRIKDDLLFDALVDIPAWYTQHPIWKAMIVGPKRILTGAITNMPAFWLANFVRDAAQSVVLSKNLKPIDPFIGFAKALTNHQDFVEMKGAGGAFIGYDLLSAQGTKALAKRAKGQRSGLGAMWDAYRKFGSAVENAVRVQEYARAKEKTGSIVEGAYRSRDLLDFASRGAHPLLHFVVSTVPFMNARIQGLRKIGVSYKDDRAGLLRRGLMLSGAALLLQSLSADDERYKALPDYDRWTNLHFFTEKNHYKIPLPFEIGAIFMSAPMALKESLMEDTYGGVAHMIRWANFTAQQTFAIDPTPQALKLVKEQWQNKVGFTGRPIVPASEANIMAKYQYSAYTPEIAKLAGEATGLSPRRIEHAVIGSTASLGKLMFSITDLMLSSTGLAPAKPEQEDRVLDALGRSRFYSRKMGYTRYQQGIEDIMPKAMQTVNTYAKLNKEKQFAEAIEVKSKNIKSFKREAILKPLRRALGANSLAAKRIVNSKTPIEKKRQMLDDITNRNIRLYRRAYERLGGKELL